MTATLIHMKPPCGSASNGDSAHISMLAIAETVIVDQARAFMLVHL
jgi:hypothetical protein